MGINKSHLRIGNWVTYLGKPCQMNMGLFTHELEPIILNAQIFAKCGSLPNMMEGRPSQIILINRNLGIGYYPTGIIQLIACVNNDGEQVHQTNVDLDIEYLHQFQNLYFSLTNTELDIEL